MKKRLKNFFKLNVGKKNKIRKELMLGMLNVLHIIKIKIQKFGIIC